MKNSFDKKINRLNSNSEKWDETENIFGAADILPLWVADMDFAVAPPITRAIIKRAEHAVYGYTNPGESLKQAVVDRLAAKWGWKIKKEWLVFSGSVVQALHALVKTYTQPGDGVIVQPPVYYPFFRAIKNNGCQTLENSLVQKEASYVMDIPGLERLFSPDFSEFKAKSRRIQLMILCSPHNPVGRVWEEAELLALGKTLLKNQTLLISDEIHSEIILGDCSHKPISSLSEELAQNTITCFSASKTFNLAGLNTSILIIPNDRTRKLFEERSRGFLATPNILGLAATEAAFKDGDLWLVDLLAYLKDNLKFLKDFFAAHIKRIKVIAPQGTYLVWLDCRDLGLTDSRLRQFMRVKAKIGLDDGYVFGSGGSGFQRVNIACPRSTLKEALRRLAAAVQQL